MASELCPCDGRTIFHELRVGKSTLNDFYMKICLIQSFFWEVNNSVKNIISYAYSRVYTHNHTHTHTQVCVLSHFSRVYAVLWTIACQAPLSMGFSRQEYESGLPCSPLRYTYTHTHIYEICVECYW